jgi:hypothetical protein
MPPETKPSLYRVNHDLCNKLWGAIDIAGRNILCQATRIFRRVVWQLCVSVRSVSCRYVYTAGTLSKGKHASQAQALFRKHRLLWEAICMQSQDSYVSIMARLEAGRPSNLGSTPTMHRICHYSTAHAAFYPAATAVYFGGDKATEACKWPPSSIWCRG